MYRAYLEQSQVFEAGPAASVDTAKSRTLAIFTSSVAGNGSTLTSPAKLDFLFNRQKSGSQAARAGAKVGANVHSHQAMPGDVQPTWPQVNGTPGDTGRRQATGRS
jgi:hypothetical protein